MAPGPGRRRNAEIAETLGMSRALLKLAKRSLPMMILRDFELLVKKTIV
jgi:hypothetical protein